MSQDGEGLKVILIGDSGVGKTALITRFIHNQFIQDTKPTIACDILAKRFTVDDNDISVVVWDTAGQERFRSLGAKFYKNAEFCVLVYDSTKEESFKSLARWKQEFHSLGHEEKDFPIIIVGNKSDQPSDIKDEEITEFCKKNGNIPNFKASARTGDNVQNAILSGIKLAIYYKKKHRLLSDTQQNIVITPQEEEERIDNLCRNFC